MNGVIRFSSRGAPVCQSCGQGPLRFSEEDQTFPYGEDKDQVILSAHVSVWSCDACGLQFTDGDSEENRHDAVCRHLGRLTPREIRDIRDKYELTQQQWAEEAGFGSASLKRWETGNQIQNETADNLMRLLAHPEIRQRLRNIKEREQGSPSQHFGFRSVMSAQVIERSHQFVLRRAVGT